MADDPPAEHDSTFAAARVYFAEAAKGFLKDQDIPEDPSARGESVERRASLLVSTLLSLVKLVIIDLDDVGDAQVIFEVLCPTPLCGSRGGSWPWAARQPTATGT